MRIMLIINYLYREQDSKLMRNVWQIMQDTGNDLDKEANSIVDEVISIAGEEKGDDCSDMENILYSNDEVADPVYDGVVDTSSYSDDDCDDKADTISDGDVPIDDFIHSNSIIVKDVADDSDDSASQVGGYQDWGANREFKDNSRKCRGFPWTNKELAIVREWKVLNPLGNIKRCLEDIYANEDFRREFHVHHVINTARLQTAWKKV